MEKAKNQEKTYTKRIPDKGFVFRINTFYNSVISNPNFKMGKKYEEPLQRQINASKHIKRNSKAECGDTGLNLSPLVAEGGKMES
jgi:hypothetical protein